jgi:uncharacterized protein YbbC (DUF1343 family)
MKKILFLILPSILYIVSIASKSLYSLHDISTTNDYLFQAANLKPILPGAYQMEEYVPLLTGKRLAVFANQTSVIDNTHLVDTLVKLGINITKIFAPEHGFRGKADAGENVGSYTDKQTGIAVISLYGKKVKPSAEDLADVDILLFDIQDVGVRCYTFISSLQYFLEAAIDNHKSLIILDRPNPNGFYVDGPVLDTAFKSFVGMQPVPLVYGMTIGEYTQMLLLENLIASKDGYCVVTSNQDTGRKEFVVSNTKESKLSIVTCKNYTHAGRYVLPVPPSPNLPDMGSIYMYPSTCFFEGTNISEGRGTKHPFQIFGHPSFPDTLYSFIPRSREGATNPKFKEQQCYGWYVNPTETSFSSKNNIGQIQLKWLLQAYKLFPDKENFFLLNQKKATKPTDYFFNKLAGSSELMQQIKDGKTEEEIRESWEPKLEAFKKIRKKYLLYPDF